MKTWKLPDKPLEYKGKWVYNWFSNFELSDIIIDGKTYPSVENYYQSQKTLDPVKSEEIRVATPGKAKQLGKKVKLRLDWEKVKVTIMAKALWAKWNQPEWIGKLLNFKGEIVEWNNWGDRIWGATLDGIGENKLGVLLMSMRDSLIKTLEESEDLQKLCADFSNAQVEYWFENPYIIKNKVYVYTKEAQNTFNEYCKLYYSIFSKYYECKQT